MSQDLRVCCLSLLFLLMFWGEPLPVSAATPVYPSSECPRLKVPVAVNSAGVWQTDSYRDLYPCVGSDCCSSNVCCSGAACYSGVSISAQSASSACRITVTNGTYYDGANHLWALNSALSCDFVASSGALGDFKAGSN